jgi:hypothetical protein
MSKMYAMNFVEVVSRFPANDVLLRTEVML